MAKISKIRKPQQLSKLYQNTNEIFATMNEYQNKDIMNGIHNLKMRNHFGKFPQANCLQINLNEYCKSKYTNIFSTIEP